MWKLMGVLCTVSGCKIWKIFLMENIRLHGMPTTSFEMVLLWKVKRYSYQFFYFLFYISFYISRYQLSRISLNIIWKKFSSQIIFFKQIHPLAPTPSPYWPKSAKRDKSFLSIFPKISDEISFFQTFIDKILQSIF